MKQRTDPFAIIETATAEAARARGWTSLGDSVRAEAALDRAMVALTRAENDCSSWARPLLEHTYAQLDGIEVK